MAARRFCASLVCGLVFLASGRAVLADSYLDPPTGWAYAYEANEGEGAAGTGGFTALDGTWSHDDGSDEWDGSVIGEGRPGGAGIVNEGEVSYLRIQDTGDPRDYGDGDPGSTRKVYLGHLLGDAGIPENALDEGVTLYFKARVPTGGLDDLRVDGGSGIVPYPSTGDGYVVHDGGKGNVGIKQGAGGIVSFSLSVIDDTGSSAGLRTNNLNGTAITGDVDTGEAGTSNVLGINPRRWNEYWVTIAAGGAGTHQVTIYVNGSTSPAAVFDVTAGSGNDFDGGSYVGIGCGSTGQSGALDVDFVRVANGTLAPQTDGTQVPMASAWGLGLLTVLLLAGGALVLSRRRTVVAAA